MYFLSHPDEPFPDLAEADNDGLLAIGGDLSEKRLLQAYRQGIFPWYNPDEPILWWSPDPRCVIFPSEFKVSKSLKQTIKSGKYRFAFNVNCLEVMEHCRQIKRKRQQGTWITDDIIQAYTNLHQKGFIVSAETYLGDELVGGLYGFKLDRMFCGESMFSYENDASKFALYHLIRFFSDKGIEIIDCQIYNPHLESLGARMIPRSTFIEYL